MKLMTKELESKFQKYPIGSQDGKGMEAHVVAKFFNPMGVGIWLITEGEMMKNGDWLFFGYCHVSCWEWGYVTLSELQAVRLPYGLTVERDMYLQKDAKVGDLIG